MPYGSLKLKLPNNQSYNFYGSKKGPAAFLEINEESSLKKIMTEGSVGFAEDFIDSKIQSTNLVDLMYYFALNNDFIEKKIKYSLIFKLINNFKHILRNNSKFRAKRNIKFHYDLGNNFYKKWQNNMKLTTLDITKKLYIKL